MGIILPDHLIEPILVPDAPHNVIQISTGSYNSWALTENGQVYSWGNNNYGELGLGDMIKRYIPTLVLKMPNDIIQISAGHSHSLALNIHNKVYSWGDNLNGQLGLGHNINELIPRLVSKMPKNIVQILAGGFHTLALTNDGYIYSFGSNGEGQLGLGDNNNKNVPTLVSKLYNKVIQIAAGFRHSLCLTSDGHIYSFGYNRDGQLGLGDYDNRNVPILIPNINNIIQISTGVDSSLALSNDGKIYAFGNNFDGQLGLGRYNNINIPKLVPLAPNNIIQISAGNNHSLVLRANGQIYAFGINNLGQLGLGYMNDDIYAPTLIPNFNVLS